MATATGERIVEAAWQLVREGGVDSLTLRALGGRVGITAAAVYRHFADKQALLQRLVDDANEVLGVFLLAGLDARGGGARFTASIARYLDFARERPAEYDVLYFALDRQDLDVPPRGQRSRNFQLFRDRVAEAMGDGTLRRADPAAVTVTVWALLHGLVALRRQGRFGDDEATFAAVCRDSLEHLLGGLKQPPATPRSKRR